MGYFVNIEESRVSIPKSRFVEACNHLNDTGFLYDTELMHGGSGHERWYAWVDMDKLWERLTAMDLPGVFDAFGFRCFYNEDGDICELAFDQKCGDELVLLNALAGFFSDGDFIEWKGEDGEVWRHEFREGRLKHMYAEIVWKDTGEVGLWREVS
jgi:hypothetical protein